METNIQNDLINLSTQEGLETTNSMTTSTWIRLCILLVLLVSGAERSFAQQGVGISETSITPDNSAILELRSTTRGFLFPRNTSISATVQGLSFFNTSTNRIDIANGSLWLEIPVKSDNLGVFASTTSAQLANVLSDETGTGLAVFATSPTLTTPNIGAATGTTLSVTGALAAQATTNQLVLGTTNTITFSATAPTASRVITFPDPGATANIIYDVLAQTLIGAKTFSALGTFNAGITATGGTVNLNASSSNNTNINTGTSTGAVAIGNSASTGISQQVGTGNFSLDGTAGSTYSIGASTTTGTISIGGTAQTGTITLGSSSAAQTVNIGTGAGAGTINIGSVASITAISSGGTTIGSPWASNGDGLRLGTSRNTVNKPTAPTTGLNANTTATVAQILDAGIIGFAATAARNLTLPSAQGATGLVQNLPGTPAVGDVFTFEVFNNGTSAVTLVAGAGITIVNTQTVLNTRGRIVYCRVTSVTAGAETISVY